MKLTNFVRMIKKGYCQHIVRRLSFLYKFSTFPIFLNYLALPATFATQLVVCESTAKCHPCTFERYDRALNPNQVLLTF